ncbi:MAG: IclR family transcriptional regulator [Actinobacteria bacterium]|jgi:DNA-binding IclR family transcriptional regulator|nr:MAG: IclR family transcriptional regulator [Actinomycetota bacterium]
MEKKNPNAIEKALDILQAFTPYNQEMGTGEISDTLGLHKATASRILRTLADKGFLQQDPDTKKFTLGPVASDIGRAYNNGLSSNLVQLAKPYIDDLRSSLEETVVLEVLSGESTVMAYIAEGPQRVRIAGTVGDRLPVHAAAGAKAILAFSPPEVIEKLIGTDLQPFTAKTITSKKAYRNELSKIRRQVFSFDGEEIDIGINAVGAPIFNHEDRAVAAVVIAGPAQRVTGAGDSEVVRKAKETAANISARLHYGGGNADERS